MKPSLFAKSFTILGILSGCCLASFNSFASQDDTVTVACPQGSTYKCATIDSEGGGQIIKMKGSGTVVITVPD